MVRVGVIGAAGKMGSMACRTVEETDGLELVARIGRGDDLRPLADAEVAVELTTPVAATTNVGWCIEHGVHVVAGTSGFNDDRLADISQRLTNVPGVGVLVVPNFSVGAVLMTRFAAQAAALFESVEIIELHHPTKLDAPSGTARRTAQLIAAARSRSGHGQVPDATAQDEVGSRGGRVDGIPVHSVRVRGLVAHQEVLLGNVGETLTIRHDMLDREAARPGLVAAVRAVPTMPGLTVGLERVLDLT
jgi:4-hydroxy-tetrahydrodipicolinate reductase